MVPWYPGTLVPIRTELIVNVQKFIPNGDSSPFQSSPFNTSDTNTSPRLFWQGRDPVTSNRFNSESGLFGQRDSSPSPTRRSSIEKLQRASRVKNSNMFAREQKLEYDPTSVPSIERPLARHVQGNAYSGSGLEGLRREEFGNKLSHNRPDNKVGLPLCSPTKTPLAPNSNPAVGVSPHKAQNSPTKSSLSNRHFNPKNSFDRENGAWPDDISGDEHELPEGKSLHFHAKSVTFDAAPPQINEYEMTTPDISSIGTGSRENSYDSGDEEADQDSYGNDDSVEREDSFDESLEDTDKTPVVGPEDWRHASPSTPPGSMAGQFEDPFGGPEESPLPGVGPPSPFIRRSSAISDESNGDSRPLPPIPGILERQGRSTSESSFGLSAAAERASSAQRILPTPPSPASISKSDIQGMIGGKMCLEERLRLMMIQDDDDKPKSPADEQRERRMRRAGSRERATPTPERDVGIHVHEDEDTLGELGDFQLPPRISRESILRKVNGHNGMERESDYNFSSPAPSSSPERAKPLDPDVPLPSTEDRSLFGNDDSFDGVIIKTEEEDIDVYSITEMYHAPSSDVGEDRYGEIGLMVQQDLRCGDDSDSQYSNPNSANQSPEIGSGNSQDGDGPLTPRAGSPTDQSMELDSLKEKEMALPEFAGFMTNNDFGLSLQSYMTPSPPPVQETMAQEEPHVTQSVSTPARPLTPPQQTIPASRPEYDGTGWGSEDEGNQQDDVGTPDSVIRHRVSTESASPDISPDIPEQVATIKGRSGSKLKTRPSATPSDLEAMREARRQVSGELANIPPIPERHRNRPSLNLELPQVELESEEQQEVSVARKSSFQKRSLTLDIGDDLGLSLDKDFDRVIEAQKVAFNPPFPSLQSSLKTGLVSRDFAVQGELNADVTSRKQRGYLMRQNTKLVIASSDSDDRTHVRGFRSAGNSPVKQERPHSWTVEPWRGQARQRSIRDLRKKVASGPVPPLPGQESNVAGLSSLSEEEARVDSVVNETAERGRLFVKVIRVKDLDLPLPKGMLRPNLSGLKFAINDL